MLQHKKSLEFSGRLTSLTPDIILYPPKGVNMDRDRPLSSPFSRPGIDLTRLARAI